METIGIDWGDPPAGWLIHVRWKAGGHCPLHQQQKLERAQVGGRTTAWCPRCQK
jgi:formamidopyrimidine-DNA glycosylase